MIHVPVVVVEGETDKLIVERLLRGVIEPPVQVVSAQGRSSAISLARTVLASRPNPVALVLDADSSDHERIEELRADLASSLAAAGSTTPFHVCLAVPTIEAWLFEDADGIRRAFDGAWRREAEIEARFAPKDAIRKLFMGRNERPSPESVGHLLDDLDLTRIRTADSVQRLVQFLVAEAPTSGAIVGQAPRARR